MEKTRQSKSNNSFFLFQLAEKRQAMVDEIAAKNLQIEEQNRTTIETFKEKHREEIERFEREIDELKVKKRTKQKFLESFRFDDSDQTTKI